MIRLLMTLACCLTCGACAGARLAPDVPLDAAVAAARLPEPALPVQIVEIPKPMPMPGQLKPLPQLSTPSSQIPPRESVNHANELSRVEPTPAGFLNAMQVWPFSPAALYQVYTMPGQVTDIALEPGEDVIDVSAPDPVRWIIGDTRSGAGQTERRHIVIKPTRADLKSNLIIFTSRRTYHLELRSTSETWIAAIAWDYPTDNLLSLKATNQQHARDTPIASGLSIDKLAFRYKISGDKPAWRPVRAFDDHEKVYIQFPDAIAQAEMPPLFVIGAAGEAQLVNYRVHAPYYVVDRLFGAAELRLGGRRTQTVRITRTDAPSSADLNRRKTGRP